MTAKHDYIPHNDADFDRWFKFLNQYVTQKCTGATPAWTAQKPSAFGLGVCLRQTPRNYSLEFCPSADHAPSCRRMGGGKTPMQSGVAGLRTRTALQDAYGQWYTAQKPSAFGLGVCPRQTPRNYSLEFCPSSDHAPSYRRMGGGKTPMQSGVAGLRTRTPHVLEFTEPQRGQTVYLALRWQNEKGEKGPWSEIQSTVIP
jgi:hypothetical protein